MAEPPLYLAVALDGAGWHPAAWRLPAARPGDLLTADYWVDLVREAERGLLDFVTIEDSVGLQTSHYDGPDGRVDQVRGRLDAVLVAARVAPATTRIGLVPTATVTHTEPFHVSRSIAALDHLSGGRAGWRPQASNRANEAAHFGRRTLPRFTIADFDRPDIAPVVTALFDETGDHVEVVRRLWDGWPVGFTGRWFDVAGPGVPPRPPQGPPPVMVLAHATIPYRLAARAADVVWITAFDTGRVRQIVAEIRAAQVAAGRGDRPLHIFGDLVVFLDKGRRDHLDELAGAEFATDTLVFAGSPADLADLMQEWREAGVTGFRLRPGAIPDDLVAITRDLTAELRRRGAFKTAYPPGTLREALHLPAAGGAR
ncbi:LLM class flavin-dependent oxidoreductase [Dactylosporangium fulvum]|uniref:LLM class flavin-dependent oxidoreductase n=1 Tax=Dactylosporangium fulvum TaxID=53359 RepID=UPI0031E196DE